jgi:serine protease Do
MRQIVMRSGSRPSEDQLASNDATPPAGAHGAKPELGPAVLGLQVAPDDEGHGVRIAGIKGDSSAAEVGLRRGDIILRAGERATHSSADLASAVSQAKAAGRKQVLLFVDRAGQHTFVPVEIGQG